MFRATEEGIGDGGVLPVYMNYGGGVLFSHRVVGALLALAGEATIGELVMIDQRR